MSKQQFNILAKTDKEKSYIILDMIATKLTKNKFLELQALNPQILGDYKFIKFNDTDFTWWSGVRKYLTPRKIVTAGFDIDYWGNVKKIY